MAKKGSKCKNVLQIIFGGNNSHLNCKIQRGNQQARLHQWRDQTNNISCQLTSSDGCARQPYSNEPEETSRPNLCLSFHSIDAASSAEFLQRFDFCSRFQHQPSPFKLLWTCKQSRAIARTHLCYIVQVVFFQFKFMTYIFKAVFAELDYEVKEDKNSKPKAPHHHLLHCLNIQHTKYEDKFVENEIPKFILQML